MVRNRFLIIVDLLYGLALVGVMGAGLYTCFQQPAAIVWAAPLTYLIVTAIGAFWLMNANRRPPDQPSLTRAASPVKAPPQPAGGPLSAHDILGWEFEYARSTAAEAMSDRQIMVNYYLAFAGAIPTAVVLVIIQGPGLEKLPAYHTLGVWALWALVVVGWVFFLKVVRLRQAWHDSARAMNTIKEFYLNHVGDFSREELNQAFLWKLNSLPRAEKKWTVFFFSASLIAFLNSLSFVLGSLLLDLQAYDLSGGDPAAIRSWLILAVYGLLMFMLHQYTYTALLKKPEPEGRIAAMKGKATGNSTGNGLANGKGNGAGKPASRPSRRVEILEQSRDYDGFFKIDRVRLRFERFDGTMSEPVTRLIFDRGDSACVLPYDPAKDAVLLIQQFRYPTYLRNGPGWLWEIVAGMQDRGRDRVTVAHAELLEEAGYQVETLVPVASFYPTPGGVSERMYLYLGYITCHNRVAAGGGLPAEQEDISISLFSFQDALRMIETGEICDAKTIIALQWLALHKNNLPRLCKS